MAIYKDVEPLELVSYESDNEEFDKGVLFILEKLDALPTADVEEVKHGKWAVDGDVTECSNCHKEYVTSRGMLQLGEFGYCPNCGAKMDERSDTQ